MEIPRLRCQISFAYVTMQLINRLRANTFSFYEIRNSIVARIL